MMFGMDHKISDASLYLLSDMVDGLLEKEKNELKNTPETEIEKRSKLTTQILYYQTEIDQFKKEIDSQLKQKFQFSTEELYGMHGQYDKYLAIEFHKYSQSAKKFGRNIYGTLTYLKSERERLDAMFSENKVTRTNDLITIDCSNDKDLSDNQKKELLETGFHSGDIYQILTTDFPKIKTFNQTGKKEIPNTITVNIDPTDFDPNKSFFWLYNQKIKNGEMLIDEEWAKFCGLALFFDPESKDFPIIKNHGFNDDGSLKALVRFYELEAKLNAKTIESKELYEFENLLKDRRTVRVEAIKYELKRSTNKKLEDFKIEYPKIYQELEKSIVQFQDESLVYFNMEKPIYWDYESFLHIYLRHCDELAIEGHFESKTKFQYNPEDIKRILKIAIHRLSPQINAKLKEGNFFRLSGNKSLYFNGNHYSLHILETGRVVAFHPLENPTD